MKSIFIQISSYHDHELPKTILNAIKMSSGKYKLNFGIHHIYHKEDDIEIPNLANVKYSISKSPNNLGMGIGRRIAHQFYNGEDYYLQIDAHSRFDPNWDKFIVSEVKRFQEIGFEKPLLTLYPKNYWYKDGIEMFDAPSDGNTYISFHENKEMFKNTRLPSQTAMTNHGNIFAKSVSGGSIFTVGDFVVPNDRIFANGEEIFIAARAFTRGYDILIPEHTYMSHLYYNVIEPEVNRRRLVWHDVSPDLLNVLTTVSYQEIYKMFTENLVGPEHLGSDRTLQDFEMYTGLDFTTGEVKDEIY
jgi:hypothetical protein